MKTAKYGSIVAVFLALVLSLTACGRQEISTENITCVDLYYKKAQACLTDPAEISEALSLVESALEKAKPVTTEEAVQTVNESWHAHMVEINREEGPELVCFSRDCSLAWTEGEDGEKMVYAMKDDEPLVDYLERMTDGVRGESTGGTAFATKDTPWDWTANISEKEVESANIYHVIRTQTEENKVSTGVSFGGFASREFSSFLKILNEIPREAFSSRKELQKRTYTELYTNLGPSGISVYMTDPVNGLAVVLAYKGNGVEMCLCDDLERTKKHGYYLDGCVSYWNVEDEALSAYLAGMMENTPMISYFVGSGYDWCDPIQVSREENWLKMSLIEGWEFEEVSEPDSFGFRCRPDGAEDGWLYFSFWPEGWEPQEQDRYYSKGSWAGWQSMTSYPDSVSSKNGVDTTDAIWSWHRIRTDKGDFAVINEGADAWFLQHKSAIEDIISFCQFSE